MAAFCMLHTLKPAKGSRKLPRRLGRGSGSGQGTTAGRGTKGQQSRTGKGRRFGFEGGQTPLVMRQPKLGGFKHPRRVEFEIVNLDTLEEKLEAGSYDQTQLRAARVIRSPRKVKLLGRGEIKKKVTLTVDATSQQAREAVEKAGGTVTVSR